MIQDHSTISNIQYNNKCYKDLCKETGFCVCIIFNVHDNLHTIKLFIDLIGQFCIAKKTKYEITLKISIEFID